MNAREGGTTKVLTALAAALAVAACGGGNNSEGEPSDQAGQHTSALTETAAPIPSVIVATPSPSSPPGPETVDAPSFQVDAPSFQDVKEAVSSAYRSQGRHVPDIVELGIDNCDERNLPGRVSYPSGILSACEFVGEEVRDEYRQTSAEEFLVALQMIEEFYNSKVDQFVNEGQILPERSQGIKDNARALFFTP